MYTIVQHSAYAINGDETFKRSVEMKSVTTKADIRIVEMAAGLLFDDYTEADEFCDKAMYPPGNDGIIGNVQGEFSYRKIDGLAIYIPVRKVVG